MTATPIDAAQQFGISRKEAAEAASMTPEEAAQFLGLSVADTAQFALAATPTKVDAASFGVPDGTVEEIKTWVGIDPIKAQRALDAENAKTTPRTTLVTWLQGVLQAQGTH